MKSRDAVATLQVHSYTTSAGGRIFQIPVQMFPGLWGWIYIVLVEAEGRAYQILIDSGSGYGDSNLDLEAGLSKAAEISGEFVSLDTLTHILITHGHIDHFGGLGYIRPRSPARIGVHELDLRNLTNYEERLAVIGRRLDNFLLEAGVGAERREKLIELYKLTKHIYQSIKVDFTYEAQGMRLGPFEMLHTPGHCAGHVVIRLHDVLFSGDHVLEHTSPHQSPEHLTLSTGLGHYLRSLEELRAWAPGIRLCLGGHEGPILDLNGRINAIQNLHLDRLNRVQELLSEPRTVSEVSQALFGEVSGYNVLLALEEAGAHVEYLYQRGRLAIANLAEVDVVGGLVPLKYRAVI